MEGTQKQDILLNPSSCKVFNTELVRTISVDSNANDAGSRKQPPPQPLQRNPKRNNQEEDKTKDEIGNLYAYQDLDIGFGFSIYPFPSSDKSFDNTVNILTLSDEPTRDRYHAITRLINIKQKGNV